MLTPLGTSQPRLHEGDLVDLLADCHRRMRRFLGIAQHLADADAVTDAEARDAAEAIRRYFTLALPLHVRDEEESIVPRLRGRQAAIDEALREMVREHRDHAPAIERLIALCQRIATAPGHRLEVRVELGAVVTELVRSLGAHLEREEAVVFPAIRKLLDAAKQAAILGELRARRSVP